MQNRESSVRTALGGEQMQGVHPWLEAMLFQPTLSAPRAITPQGCLLPCSHQKGGSPLPRAKVCSVGSLVHAE